MKYKTEDVVIDIKNPDRPYGFVIEVSTNSTLVEFLFPDGHVGVVHFKNSSLGELKNFNELPLGYQVQRTIEGQRLLNILSNPEEAICNHFKLGARSAPVQN